MEIRRKNAFPCDFFHCFLIHIQPGIWIPVYTIVCTIELCFAASLPSMFVFHTFYFQDDYLVFITDIFHIFIGLKGPGGPLGHLV